MAHSQTLNTGANPNYGRHALKRAASLLQKSKARVITPVGDKAGIYAFEMQGWGQRFYLVARTTKPMRYQGSLIVSSQKAILAHCRRDGIPLLMAITSGPRGHESMSAPDWRLFHPEEIVFYSEGDNDRDGIIMVNWDYRLGRSLEWPGALPDVWQEMKEAWRNEEAPPRAETRDLRDYTE